MNPLAALQGISFGPQGSYQDLLSQEQLKAAKQQGLLGFGSAMLANSGWSTQRPSLGAALGQGVMAGSQMQQQAQQQALQGELLKRKMNAPGEGFTLNPGDVRFDANGNPIAAVAAKPGDKWRPPTAEERALYKIPEGAPAQINEQSGKIEWRQNGSLVTVNTGKAAEGPMSIYSDDAKSIRGDLMKLQEDAVGLNTALAATENAQRALEGGIISGFGADFRLGFARFANLVGANDAETIANTEAYISETGQLVGQIIKQFGAGTGLSDADREFARKIAAGEIGMNEETLRRVLDLRARALKGAAETYNRRLNAVAKQYTGTLDFFPLIEIPKSDGDWVTMPGGARIRVKQ